MPQSDSTPTLDPQSNPDLIPLREAAAMADTPYSTAYLHARSADEPLEAKKIGGKLYVTRDSLVRYVGAKSLEDVSSEDEGGS